MPTLSAKVHSRLAEDIIKGKFAPGERLDEQMLADMMGVSRTPVREALRQLASRGLVQMRPMRGAVVSHIGINEVTDLLNANSELEAMCARISAESMSQMEKMDLEYAFELTKERADAGDLDGYLEANAQFHRMIVAGSHNSVLTAMVLNVRERLTPFRRYHPADAQRIKRSESAHREILVHIQTGAAEEAYQAMRAHSAQLGSAALRALRDAQTQHKQKILGDLHVVSPLHPVPDDS
jgi:DNA-binding GntR family transcriptional regulator